MCSMLEGKPWKILIHLAGRRTFQMQTAFWRSNRRTLAAVRTVQLRTCRRLVHCSDCSLGWVRNTAPFCYSVLMSVFCVCSFYAKRSSCMPLNSSVLPSQQTNSISVTALIFWRYAGISKFSLLWETYNCTDETVSCLTPNHVVHIFTTVL